LVVGSGPNEVREKLFALMQRNPQLFRGADKESSEDDWIYLYKSVFVPKDLRVSAAESVIQDTIKKCWEQFLRDDLPALRKAVAGIK
jgi:hypothetical protein